MKYVFAFLFLCSICFADIRIDVFQPTTQVLLNQPSVNANGVYLFTPLYPATSVTFFFRNNSSVAKTITVNFFSTPDVTLVDWTNNQSGWLTLTPSPATGCSGTISAGTTISCYISSVYAAQIAFQVTGFTAGGTTDTQNVFISQSPYPPFGPLGASVISVMGTTRTGSAVPAVYQQPVLIGGYQTGACCTAQYVGVNATVHGLSIGNNNGISDLAPSATSMQLNDCAGGACMLAVMQYWQNNHSGSFFPTRARGNKLGMEFQDAFHYSAGEFDGGASLQQSFNVQFDLVNPAAGFDIFNLTGSQSFHAYRVTLACTAACDVIVNKVSTAGTVCTAVTATRVSAEALGGTALTLSKNCTGALPTVVAPIFHYWNPANDTRVYDLSAYWQGNAAASGFDFTVGGVLAGTMSITVEWYEN